MEKSEESPSSSSAPFPSPPPSPSSPSLSLPLPSLLPHSVNVSRAFLPRVTLAALVPLACIKSGWTDGQTDGRELEEEDARAECRQLLRVGREMDVVPTGIPIKTDKCPVVQCSPERELERITLRVWGKQRRVLFFPRSSGGNAHKAVRACAVRTAQAPPQNVHQSGLSFALPRVHFDVPGSAPLTQGSQNEYGNNSNIRILFCILQYTGRRNLLPRAY